MLEEIDHDPTWIERVQQIENPFGRGDSGPRIAAVVAELLGVAEPGARPAAIEQRSLPPNVVQP
jgi:hypothetical protein